MENIRIYRREAGTGGEGCSCYDRYYIQLIRGVWYRAYRKERDGKWSTLIDWQHIISQCERKVLTDAIAHQTTKAITRRQFRRVWNKNPEEVKKELLEKHIAQIREEQKCAQQKVDRYLHKIDLCEREISKCIGTKGEC